MFDCASFASLAFCSTPALWADRSRSAAASLDSSSFTRGSGPAAGGAAGVPPETLSRPPHAGHLVGAAADPSRTRYIFAHWEHSRSMRIPPVAHSNTRRVQVHSPTTRTPPPGDGPDRPSAVPAP